MKKIFIALVALCLMGCYAEPASWIKQRADFCFAHSWTPVYRQNINNFITDVECKTTAGQFVIAYEFTK